MNTLKKDYSAPMMSVAEFDRENVVTESVNMVIDDQFHKGNNATNVGSVNANEGFFSGSSASMGE